MFGNFSKPLHVPPPRRRDRRGGARSAVRNAALLDALRDEPPAPAPTTRTRRAVARLHDRLRTGRPAAWLSSLVLLGLIGLGTLGVVAVLPVADLEPYAGNEASYARLHRMAVQSCGEVYCGFGAKPRHVGHFPQADRLRIRLRVTEVTHLPHIGRTVFEGASGRRWVVYEPEGSASQVAARAQTPFAVEGATRTDHGGGWVEIARP